jgi:hypothetical protein
VRRLVRATARPMVATVAGLTLTFVLAGTLAMPLVPATAVAVVVTTLAGLAIRTLRLDHESPVAEPVDWDRSMRDLEAWAASRPAARRRNPERRP